MEIVGRMMDGSVSYPPNEPRETPIVLGPKVGQDQKMAIWSAYPSWKTARGANFARSAGSPRRWRPRQGRSSRAQESPAINFFFIIDGAARVEVPPQSHHRVGPGEFFGEMSLLDGRPRSATVLAGTPVRLLVVHRRDFWKLLKEAPALTEQILVTVSQRVRRAEKAVGV